MVALIRLEAAIRSAAEELRHRAPWQAVACHRMLRRPRWLARPDRAC
jgi:hypothetical protein